MYARFSQALERVMARRGRAFFPVTLVAAFVLLFTVVYRFMGVEDHFEITEEQRGRPWFASFYVSCMSLTNAMGDSAPRTMWARRVYLAQVLAGFFILLLGGILF